MGQRKTKVSPRETAAALILASQACHWAALAMQADDDADVLVHVSIQVAGALTYLSALGRKDKRFTFDVIRDSLLEFLPPLLLGTVTAERVLLVGRQLDLLSQEVLVVIQTEDFHP